VFDVTNVARSIGSEPAQQTERVLVNRLLSANEGLMERCKSLI